jgi:hypothetical protein
MSIVLVACGVTLAGVGAWRGYRSTRAALLPLHEGDPTRTMIDAARPIHARMGVRRAARAAVGGLAWLTVALYGVVMAQAGFMLDGTR